MRALFLAPFPLKIFPPPLGGDKVRTEGGKHLLPSFIMIYYLCCFGSYFFKTVNPNEHMEIKWLYLIYLPPPSWAVRYMYGSLRPS